MSAESPLTEFQAAQVLSDVRQADENCVGDSFPTISATGANAAVIHCKTVTIRDLTLKRRFLKRITVPDQPDPRECSPIAADGIYLCDTGGQYKDGTTDITRTLHFGTPSEEEKRCYTRCEATKQAPL